MSSISVAKLLMIIFCEFYEILKIIEKSHFYPPYNPSGVSQFRHVFFNAPACQNFVFFHLLTHVIITVFFRKKRYFFEIYGRKHIILSYFFEISTSDPHDPRGPSWQTFGPSTDPWGGSSGCAQNVTSVYFVKHVPK